MKSASGRVNRTAFLVAIAAVLGFVVAPFVGAAHTHGADGPRTLCPLCIFGTSSLLVPSSFVLRVSLESIADVSPAQDRCAFVSPPSQRDVRAPPSA